MLSPPFLFLSHSGVDSAEARELKGRIEASPSAKLAGLKVWFDKDDLAAGAPWQLQLGQIITERCTAFAVYVGSKGVMNWVETEVSLGLSRATTDKSFPFIPILAQKSTAAALPPFAALYQAVQDPLNDPAEMEKFLKAILEPRGPVVILDEPFVGLRAMTEADAARFFGRTAEINELVKKLENSRFVAVVADSGSGKSSLVQAGLIPKFRGGVFAENAREELASRIWHVVTTRPGSSPFEQLRMAVTAATERLALSPKEKAELGDLIDPSKPQRTAYALQCNLRTEATETLLVIDQFEELFTQTPEHLRAPFIDWVLSLIATQAVLKFRVILTIRSDYFNLCSTHSALFALVKQDNVKFRLKRITDEGLVEAIRKPLSMAGHKDDAEQDALVAQIRRDVSDRPGDLALVQMALFETWKQHNLNGLGLLEAYTAIGGVSGALAHAAEDVRTNKLDPKQQDLLEPIFVRLVNLGDAGGATRRVAKIAEFDEARQELIKLLSNEKYSRLLLLGAETVDICHEQLITQWPWLQTRITGSAVDVRRLGLLIGKTSQWKQAEDKNKNEYLATGAELEIFDDLATRHADWLSPPEIDYAKGSKNAQQREERQRSWLFRGVVAASVLFAAAAVIAGLFYLSAQKQAQIAEEQRRAAQAQAQIASEQKEEAQRQTEIAEEQRRAAREQAKVAEAQTKESRHQLDRANKALAAGILADLDLKRGDPLTARQRNALWKLATADEAVRDQFISSLSASGEEIARIGARFREVSRSLGLQWPSPVDAERLLATAVKSTHQYIMGDALRVLAVTNLTEAQAQQALDALLQQIGKTTDSDALLTLARALQAVGPNLTEAQAQQALDPLLQQIGETTNSNALRALAEALRAVVAKLTGAQAQQALDPLLRQIGTTTDFLARQALAEALLAVAANLSEAQAQQSLNPLLQQIGKTTNPEALQALAETLQAMAPKLTEAQAQQVLDPLLQQIGEATDFDALRALAEALRAVVAKLTGAQAQQALDPLLRQIGKSTSPFALGVLARALEALPAKLTEAQAQQVLDPLLHQIGKTTNSNALQVLAAALQAMAANLTEAQAQQALDPLLQQIGKSTDPLAVQALAATLQAMAPNLTEEQAQQVLDPLLQQIGETTDPRALPALLAMAPKLTESQAHQVLDTMVQRIGNTTDRDALEASAATLQAMAPKLTEAQAHQVLDTMVQRIGNTTDRDALQALAATLQAMAANLTEAQAQQALDPLLQQMGQTPDPYTIQALAEALQALPTKLTEAQAQQALDPPLQLIGKTTNSNALRALAEALRAVVAKLTGAQAQQALDPLLHQIGTTTNSYAHQLLAKALKALPAKLTDAQAEQAFAVAMSSLAWAATEDEAADWARAAVALMPSAAVQADQGTTRKLVSAMVYPTAAGSATEILLDALRARRPDAPAKEAGTAAIMAWIADTYPNEVHRAVCPLPPQSDLKCP